jgi:hypothetical protein
MVELPYDVLFELAQPSARCDLAVGSGERSLQRHQHFFLLLTDDRERCIENRALTPTFEEPTGRSCEPKAFARP